MSTTARLLALGLIAAALLIPCSLLIAHEGDTAAVEEVEEVMEIEEIEEVSPAGEVEQAGLYQTIGKFHPVVLHFPIAWLILLVIVEAVFLAGLAGELDRWGLALLVLTLLSFIPAIVSGLGMASGYEDSAQEFVDKMHLHRNFNIASGVVLLGALAVRVVIGRNAGKTPRVAYFILVLAAAGLLGFGSHLGGEMVWGEGFLPLPF